MDIDLTFWIKFFVLFIPFTIMMWVFAPSLKWKILFTFASAVGVALALSGLSLRERK